MLTEKLLNAASSGELVRVRYFGGSKPGAERQLRPISVGDGKVRALCMETGATKLFVIDKMEEVIDGVPSAMAAVQLAAPTTFPSLEDFAARYRGDFEACGWVVQQGPQAVSLHRTSKDGKIVRSPMVDLSFEAETYDVMFDGEQLTHENHRSRARPWIVRGKDMTTKTFADLEKAQLAFLEFTKQVAAKAAKLS